MHQRSLVHGHIKGVLLFGFIDPGICWPTLGQENILVDDDGNPRIADNSFGSILGYLDEERQRELTAVISDLRWWPPEDFTQKDSEPRRPSKEGDIWSLGMTVFVSLILLIATSFDWSLNCRRVNRNYGPGLNHTMRLPVNGYPSRSQISSCPRLRS